jgi:hypothetical protein
MNLKEFKKALHKNPKFKKEYEKFDLLFELCQILIEIKIITKVLLNKIRGRI